MSDHSPLARGLLVVVLTIGVLGFGAVGLCSGIAAVRAVPALFRQGGSVSLVILVGALSCALAGFFMVRVCVRELQRAFGKVQSEDDPS